MNTRTIDEVMIIVIGSKKTVCVDSGVKQHFVKWDKKNNEPVVMYPAIDDITPIETGVVGCVSWLRQLPKDSKHWITSLELNMA